ncbi:M14 family metallocarboxypeptidase [Alteromonas pelagimontana]|uniref:M14 family metallocarboxypeptidase n=1 Tax=Alteromonas pelagimontana TaxID=1858656 RepID=A0A6M4M9F4_9ALTE|nr:M14 family metallocarboxypeptidase [Alteromonas pelagimontana]QJR79784.1 M14 family metallocarboxypeptidase [Alteromonas pelagimontana]
MQQYPIGTPDKPWTEEDKAEWKAQQQIQRRYKDEVLAKLPDELPGFSIVKYGALPYDETRYPLFAVVSETLDENKPTVLITGGVHGYETSGVQGALQFINGTLSSYQQDFNFVVVPCVSPWGYETINRWNPLAIDPNRSFQPNSLAPESAQLMAFIASLNAPIAMHIDLHETTDTDNSEFRPALAARNGTVNENWNIPDGFYLVTDSENPQLSFQEAVIAAVREVTHIAPADENNKLIGAAVLSEGVIGYNKKALYLCGGMTDAKYVTTTEVYPDSPSATAEGCNKAQIAAIEGGLAYLKKQIS